MIIVVGGDDLRVCGARWDQLMVEWKIDCLNCVGVVEIRYLGDMIILHDICIESTLPLRALYLMRKHRKTPRVRSHEATKPRSHRCCYSEGGDCKRLAGGLLLMESTAYSE